MTTQFCTLQHDALLHITGPDSLKFLQGQTTCDAQSVSDTHAVAGAYCTPQGRVVCDFLLARLGDDHFGMRMRRAIVSKSADVFAKYIIFSKAELAPQRDDWAVVAVWGDEAASALAEITGSDTGGQYGTSSNEGLCVVQLDDTATLFECYVSADQLEAFIDQASARMSPGSEAHWQARQIEGGIARIETTTVEEFVPQVVNYDIIGHVNFKKGCYTGQEVVARLHYRGTPKRRTFVALLPAPELPEPGTLIFTDESEQSVGMVVNAAAGETGVAALVAVTLASATRTLHLQAPDGPSFTVTSPPYSLDQES